MLDRIIKERLTVRQTEEEISKILNKNVVDNDIPNEIQKFLDEEDVIKEDKELDNTENNNIEPKVGEFFVSNIPEVVDINEIDNKKDANINPFQSQFVDNIRKIKKMYLIEMNNIMMI